MYCNTTPCPWLRLGTSYLVARCVAFFTCTSLGELLLDTPTRRYYFSYGEQHVASLIPNTFLRGDSMRYRALFFMKRGTLVGGARLVPARVILIS